MLHRLLARLRSAPVSSGPEAAAQLAMRQGRTAQDWITRGNAELDHGRIDDAIDCYRQACAADAGSGDAHVNLGFALSQAHRYTDALAVLRQSLVLVPASADANYLFGAAQLASGCPSDAVPHLERAIALRPALLAAHRDLGRALFERGDVGDAEAALKAGLLVDGEDVDLNLFLGNVYAESHRWDDATQRFRAVLALQPGHSVAHSNLAPALLHVCDFAGATAAARSALAVDPGLMSARSNLLMAMSRDPDCRPQDYLGEARTYGQHAMARADALRAAAPSSLNSRATSDARDGRPLRVGLVSGDLCRHPVGFFLEQVLAHWDHETKPLYLYSNRAGEDDLTQRLRASADGWTSIARLSDAEAFDLVVADRIDILIDLSGHTPLNRLGLFALRPAPVQAAWLGYWASTGLPTIDFVVADPVSVPPGHEDQFSERVWRLPSTRMCFTPPHEAPPVAPLPALRSGTLTFGSFQNPIKLNPAVLALWSKVLAGLPGSRLRVQALQLGSDRDRASMAERLLAAGIHLDRVEIHGPSSRAGYLAAHADVDVILDTFPHAGGTTTCEALWMGVPTITLAGGSMLARQGASLMAAAGLSDWVARDEEEFVALALRAAGNLGALGQLRQRLRADVAASSLFDGATFASELQAAIDAMFRSRAADGDVRVGGRNVHSAN